MSNFQSVIIDENLTLENPIEVIENNISQKNIGAFFRFCHLLDSPSFTFTSIKLKLHGLVLSKLNSKKS